MRAGSAFMVQARPPSPLATSPSPGLGPLLDRGAIPRSPGLALATGSPSGVHGGPGVHAPPTLAAPQAVSGLRAGFRRRRRQVPRGGQPAAIIMNPAMPAARPAMWPACRELAEHAPAFFASAPSKRLSWPAGRPPALRVSGHSGTVVLMLLAAH